jgi:hypothetical protein
MRKWWEGDLSGISVSAKSPLEEDENENRMRRTFLGPMGLLEDLRLPMMCISRFVRDGRVERQETKRDETKRWNAKRWQWIGFADVKLSLGELNLTWDKAPVKSSQG